MKERTAPPEEDFGVWCEMTPLYLATSFDDRGENPWDSYFRPMMSMTNESGSSTYMPDIKNVTVEVVEHWATRARSLKHPVLRARLADAAWELSPFVTNSRKRDIAMARIAIQAYIEAVAARLDASLHDAFASAQRALDLAAHINDPDGIDKARAALLELHRAVIATKEPHMWSRAYDHLVHHKKARTTAEELDSLVSDLEGVLARVSNPQDSATFDPHETKAVAERLSRHHISKNRLDDDRRVHSVLAGTFEFAAGFAGPTVAASFLQDSVDAYQRAGRPDEAARIRVDMQKKLLESRNEMGQFSIPIVITEEEMNALVDRIVVDDPAQTLVNIAVAFLPSPEHMDKEMREIAKDAPLFALLSQQIVSEDRVAARIGSVEEDPSGRVLMHTVRWLKIRFFADLRELMGGRTAATATLLVPSSKTAGGRSWPRNILLPGWEAG